VTTLYLSIYRTFSS